jgi:hypothetical protein
MDTGWPQRRSAAFSLRPVDDGTGKGQAPSWPAALEDNLAGSASEESPRPPLPSGDAQAVDVNIDSACAIAGSASGRVGDTPDARPRVSSEAVPCSRPDRPDAILQRVLRLPRPAPRAFRQQGAMLSMASNVRHGDTARHSESRSATISTTHRRQSMSLFMYSSDVRNRCRKPS